MEKENSIWDIDEKYKTEIVLKDEIMNRQKTAIEKLTFELQNAKAIIENPRLKHKALC